MTRPFFSVCIPVYNGEQYLRKCLDSIFAQTYQDFEIVAVDDCSTDGSVELIQSYQSRGKPVRLFRNPQNLGLVKNWNKCLNQASGVWIKYLFQDDFWDPDCLRTVYSQSTNSSFIFHARNHVIEKNVNSFLNAFYSSERVRDMPELRGKTELSTEDINELISKNLLFNFFGEPSCVAFRRDNIARFGYFNEDLIQLCDYEYWCRIASNTGANYIKERLLTFAVHGNSATSSNLTSKKLRFTYIDHLIIFKEFSESPIYSSLRTVAAGLKVNFENMYNERLRRMVYFLFQQPAESRINLNKEIGIHAPFLSPTTSDLRRMYFEYKIRRLFSRLAAWLKFR